MIVVLCFCAQEQGQIEMGIAPGYSQNSVILCHGLNTIIILVIFYQLKYLFTISTF